MSACEGSLQCGEKMANMKGGIASAVNDEKRWQAEDDARSLRRAAEIMGDKARHSAAKAHIKGEIGQMQRVLSTGDAGGPKLGPKPPAPKKVMKNQPEKKSDFKQFPKPPATKAK